MFTSKVVSSILAISTVMPSVLGFNPSANNNLAVYWGQNSYGATHGDTANWQQRLSYYCQDDAIDIIPLGFLHVFFSVGGLPEINMANRCSGANNGVFPGTALPNCAYLAEDIKACQARGKIITLSLGGATGGATFTSDSQAQQFAQTIWNLFFDGSSNTRPFGNAVLDGIDLDLEGGSGVGLAALVNKFRSLAAGKSKRYYVSAAPQCPYPDAYMGSALNAASFDMVFVQFYNNYCSLQSYGTGSFNFGDWHNWATSVSPNRNVKVYLGAPASSTALYGAGYVPASQVVTIANDMKSRYSSFGGVMLWDASQAYANGRYDRTVKSGMGGSTGGTTTIVVPPVTTTPGSTTTTDNGSCGSTSAWSASATYVGGDYVTYGGSLWRAQWWTLGDTPGGQVGVWVKVGACVAGNKTEAPAPVASPSPDFGKKFDHSGVAPIKVSHPDANAVKSIVEARATPAPVSKSSSSRFFKDTMKPPMVENQPAHG